MIPVILPLTIDCVRLVRFRLPLVTPFRTAHGVEHERDVILVHVVADEGEGWGENVAMTEPTYSHEFVAASAAVLEHHLVPRILGVGVVSAERVADLVGDVQGWQMAKCALEAAVLDAQLRAADVSLRTYLGGMATRIRPGVAVGMHSDIASTVEAAAAAVAMGYARVKLKIEPGRDVDVVRAVRERVGPDVLLQVDANAAYSLSDSPQLGRLDDFGLLFIEQPFASDDLLDHAELARRIATPICLDEGITSLRTARAAVDLGACSVINVKPGRVGGYLEARRIHDLCLERDVPVWCGGMLETAVGRGANLALASLPGFRFPPDLSASSRYFLDDIATPFELRDGYLDVPIGPGIGVTPDAHRLRELDATVLELRP